MRQFLNRLRFARRFKRDFTMVYDASTGRGLKPLRYSPFSDCVHVRFSQFGTVSMADFDGEPMGRECFLALYAQPKWERV